MSGPNQQYRPDGSGPPVCIACNRNLAVSSYRAFCRSCDRTITDATRAWARGPGSKWERDHEDEAMSLERMATEQTYGGEVK